MFWSLSFQLLPDEEIVDDSTRMKHAGIRPAYSAFLTNKRVIFRFDGLGSSLTQSFFYHEIKELKPVRRLFISYLEVKTAQRDFLLNIVEPEYWAKRIVEMKEQVPEEPASGEPKAAHTPGVRKRALFDMLVTLRKNSLLTEGEFDDKVHLLDSLHF